MSFGPVTAAAERDEVLVRNDFFEVAFRRPEPAVSFRDGLAFRCLPRAAALVSSDEQLEVRIDDPVLVRIVHSGTLGRQLSFRITYDAFQSRNLHVYVRVEATEDVEASDLELPGLEFEGASFGDSTAGRWLDLGTLGLVVKKPLWHA